MHSHLGDFQDQRVLLTNPGDCRLAMRWDDCGGFEQGYAGPTFVVIGEQTTDEKCASLAHRFGLRLADVFAFRDAAALPRNRNPSRLS